MSKNNKDRVLVFVKNDPFKDSRVDKIVRTMLLNNYNVDLIGVHRNNGIVKKRFLGHANYYPIYLRKGSSKIAKIFENIGFFILALARSLCLFFTKKYQFIYLNTPPNNLIFIALLLRIVFPFKKFKIISDIHDLEPEFYQTQFGKDLIYNLLLYIEKMLVHYSDALIVTNQSYKNIILDRSPSLDAKKMFIVKNYPNISDYNIFKKARPLTSNNKKVVLYVGSINPQDGVIEMIDSIKYIVNDREKDETEFWIVGEGEDLDKANRLVNDLGLADSVTFWGGVWDRKKLARIIKTADICLEPAPNNQLNRHSTFIKVFEYILAEKPIVAYRLKETVISAKGSSVYVDPADKLGFGQAILSLLSSQREITKRVKNAKRLAEKYIWEYGPGDNLLSSLEFVTKNRMKIAKNDSLIIRIFDLIFSLLALLIFSPLMVLVGLIIKLESGGTIIYRQKRVGLNQKIFTIYKFKTMSGDVKEEALNIDPENPNVQVENDPRVTKVGNFLRRYSIDELPQLINVVKGEMSLVGPRPLIKREVDYFKKSWKKRFLLKPGITGLAQINGRGNLLVKEAVAYDTKLVEEFNVGLYFLTILKTIRSVLTGKESF